LPVGHMVIPCHSRCISMTRCHWRPPEQVPTSRAMPVKSPTTRLTPAPHILTLRRSVNRLSRWLW